MADNGVTCSMSRSGNVGDNAAMESFFSSLKTERTGSKTYRTRDEGRAGVFDYIERFYNAKRRHSTIGYLSPMEFDQKAGPCLTACHPNRVQATTRCSHRRRPERSGHRRRGQRRDTGSNFLGCRNGRKVTASWSAWCSAQAK
jgi:putative transposase